MSDTVREVSQELSPEMRAATSWLIERVQFMKQAGISFKGARDLYEVLGYDRQITNRQYRDRYARGGIAARVVEAYPKETWRGVMELVDDEDPTTDTEFEKAWNNLSTRLRINSVLQRADILAGLSTFSVILIGAPGKLSEPLPFSSKGPDDIIYLSPFSGGGGPGMTSTRAVNVDADATIKELEGNYEDPRFALPLFYQLRRTDIVDPEFQKPVHWSRILHIAEGLLDDQLYGQPTLESVWNLLDDLDKVTGGGAEAFWLRANQGLHLDIDKDMGGNAALSKDELTSLQNQMDEYQHKMRRALRTRGVAVSTLGSDTADFSGPSDTIITQIAGTKGIPKRILTGSEMGTLASQQDRDNWKAQVSGRQIQYAETYIIRPFVDRLIEFGYLPHPLNEHYEVRWPPIQVLTEEEKAAGALSWAQANQADGRPVFLADEIRDHWYGLEPLTPEQVDAEIPEPKVAPDQQKQVDQLAAALGAGKSINLVVGKK